MDMVRPLRGEVAGRPKTIQEGCFVKKSPLSRRIKCPYRKPTQVGGGKNPKVIERTLVKELGNLTP